MGEWALFARMIQLQQRISTLGRVLLIGELHVPTARKRATVMGRGLPGLAHDGGLRAWNKALAKYAGAETRKCYAPRILACGWYRTPDQRCSKSIFKQHLLVNLTI